MTTSLSLRIAVVFLATSVVFGRADAAPYSQVARVPSIVNGQALSSFAFDPVDQRLYAGSQQGV
ncbi:MAG: hypothetical protein HQ485_03450 [Acidobacteria bacterium]|nr:hypothetical protein [Acidobacteriota bacterium]